MFALGHNKEQPMTTPLIRALFCVSSFCIGWTVQAQTAWPDKPIKLIVPFSAGGANDLMARAAAEGATKALGQTVIVENKPGGSTTLGADLVARSPADGYTFLISAAGGCMFTTSAAPG